MFFPAPPPIRATPPPPTPRAAKTRTCAYVSVFSASFKTILFSTQKEKPTLFKWWKVFRAHPISEVSGNRGGYMVHSSTVCIVPEVNSSSALLARSLVSKQCSPSPFSEAVRHLCRSFRLQKC